MKAHWLWLLATLPALAAPVAPSPAAPAPAPRTTTRPEPAREHRNATPGGNRKEPAPQPILKAGTPAPAAAPGSPVAAPTPAPAPPAPRNYPGLPAVKPYEPRTQQAETPQQVTLPGPPVLPAETPAGVTLSLDQALQIAWRYQASLRLGLGQVQAARGRTLQTAAALNPRLGLSVGYQDPLAVGAPSITTGTTTPTTLTGSQAGQGNIVFNDVNGNPITTGGNTGTTVVGNAAAAAGSSAAGSSSATAASSASSVNVGNFFAPGGFTYTATLNQLIYDFNHTKDLVRSLEEQERSARAGYEQTEVNLVRDVKNSYYSLLQAVRLVQVQDQNLANQRVHVAEAQARFASGLGLPSDVTRAQTAVSNALYNLSNAQNQEGLARLQLSTTLGLDPRTRVEILDHEEPDPAVSNVNDLFATGLQRRPELIQYRASLAAAQATLDAAHTTSSPALAGSLQYQNRQNPSFESLILGLTLNYQAFDGGLQAGRVEEARGALEQARANLTIAEQRVLSEIGQAYLNMKNAEQKVSASQAEVANATETLRLAEGRYRVGLGIFLNVIDGQNALLVAQSNSVNSVTQLYLSRATLLQAVGAPVPNNLPRLDPRPPVAPELHPPSPVQ